MTEVVNLNKARKARNGVAAKLQATRNRAEFGRSKAERASAKAEREKVARLVDGAKREP